MKALKQYMEVTPSKASRQSTHPLAMGKEVDLDTPDWSQEAPYNSKCPYLAPDWQAYVESLPMHLSQKRLHKTKTPQFTNYTFVQISTSFKRFYLL